MNKTACADIVIFGGGIAGLWLLSRIKQAGYSALLFESNTLGGGQTHKAQGIIHGGMKYALTGKLTEDALAVSDMPRVWRECLSGKSNIDLSSVKIMSDHHYLWSPNSFGAKLAGFFASKSLNTTVKKLPSDFYPNAFKHASFKGDIYELDEIVVNVPSLVRELAKANRDAIYKIEPLAKENLHFGENGKLTHATVHHAGMSLDIKAQQFIFAAGSGNEVVLDAKKIKQVAMQRRPLHMVMVKTPFDFPVYAHCLGLGARPRLTITTHYLHSGEPVWYLGGLLSEEGIDRNEEQQIAAAKKELNALFPWLDFTSAEYSTFRVDRAEPKTQSGFKPEKAFSKTIDNVTIAWPTKLALTPMLAEEVVKQFNLSPARFDVRELRTWPMPTIAKPIWEQHFCKSVA